MPARPFHDRLCQQPLCAPPQQRSAYRRVPMPTDLFARRCRARHDAAIRFSIPAAIRAAAAAASAMRQPFAMTPPDVFQLRADARRRCCAARRARSDAVVMQRVRATRQRCRCRPAGMVLSPAAEAIAFDGAFARAERSAALRQRRSRRAGVSPSRACHVLLSQLRRYASVCRAMLPPPALPAAL